MLGPTRRGQEFEEEWHQVFLSRLETQANTMAANQVTLRRSYPIQEEMQPWPFPPAILIRNEHIRLLEPARAAGLRAHCLTCTDTPAERGETQQAVTALCSMEQQTVTAGSD